MGDFNAACNPAIDRPYNSKLSNNWKPEAEIFNFLNDWTFTDIQMIWEMELPSPTWIGRAFQSRIDYIWISPDIALNNVHSFTNERANNIVNSDHTLLNLKLFSEGITKMAKHVPLRKKGKTTTILYQKSTTEQWTQFANKIEEKIENHNLNQKLLNIIQLNQQDQTNITNNSQANESQTNNSRTNSNTLENELETIWQEFTQCITSAAYSTLPTARTKNKNHSIQKEKLHPPEFHEYHKALCIIKIFNTAEQTINKEDIQNLLNAIHKFNNS